MSTGLYFASSSKHTMLVFAINMNIKIHTKLYRLTRFTSVEGHPVWSQKDDFCDEKVDDSFPNP